MSEEATVPLSEVGRVAFALVGATRGRFYLHDRVTG